MGRRLRILRRPTRVGDNETDFEALLEKHTTEKFITDRRTGLQYELVGDRYLIAGERIYRNMGTAAFLGNIQEVMKLCE